MFPLRRRAIENPEMDAFRCFFIYRGLPCSSTTSFRWVYSSRGTIILPRRTNSYPCLCCSRGLSSGSWSSFPSICMSHVGDVYVRHQVLQEGRDPLHSLHILLITLPKLFIMISQLFIVLLESFVVNERHYGRCYSGRSRDSWGCG